MEPDTAGHPVIGAGSPLTPDSNQLDRHTLAFEYVLRRLPERKLHILDMGPAQGPNVNFFSSLRSKVYIADFYGGLVEAGPRYRADAVAFASACAGLLPYPAGTHFDLILCWDLFNYLTLEEIEELGAHLAQCCSSDTLLMSMVSIRPKIPSRPYSIEIVDKDTLRYQPGSDSMIPGPLHTERDLTASLDGFRVRKAFLLKRGIQEYVMGYG